MSDRQSYITSLENVRENYARISKNFVDEQIEVKSIQFMSLEAVRMGDKVFQMTQIAQSSACYRTGTPLQYLRKCPPELQARNLNYWIEKEKNEKLLVRFNGDKVRAIFTPTYKPTNDDMLLDAVEKKLGIPPSTQVKCFQNENFLQINIPNDQQTFSISGDRMMGGMSFFNSEVGLTKIGMSVLVYRLSCTNGMISKQRLTKSFKHITEPEVILAQFPEIAKELSGRWLSEKELLEKATNVKIHDPQVTIESFNKRFQFRCKKNN